MTTTPTAPTSPTPGALIALLDGTNLVMRYASAMLPDPTAASPVEVEKVLRAVLRCVREFCAAVGARHAILAVDSTGDSWRRARYPDYKANRPPGVTGVWSNRLAVAGHEAGFRVERAFSYEADDVIATLAARLGAAGLRAAVLSGDSDLLQVASLWTTCYTFGGKDEPRFKPLGLADIAAKYELPRASFLAYYKAIVGEKGDNLPGVRGVGPVKARALLSNATALPDAQAVSLLVAARYGPAAGEEFLLMHDLVRLCDDLPLDGLTLASCRVPLTPDDPR
jgi:5'-3' exonuclease